MSEPSLSTREWVTALWLGVENLFGQVVTALEMAGATPEPASCGPGWCMEQSDTETIQRLRRISRKLEAFSPYRRAK
jgi:hypothetical protein